MEIIAASRLEFHPCHAGRSRIVAVLIGTRNLLDMTLLGFSLFRYQTRASATEISVVVTRSRPVLESTNTKSLRPPRAFDEAQDSVYDGGFRAARLQARRKDFKGVHPECCVVWNIT